MTRKATGAAFIGALLMLVGSAGLGAAPAFTVVIREKGGSVKGTGFVWPERGGVVTSYHVVVACQQVEVSYDDGANYKLAEIERVFRQRDLALLRVAGAPDIPAAEIRVEAVAPTMKITAYGRGAGLNTIVSYDGTTRTSPVLTDLETLLDANARQPLVDAGYPELSSEIIFSDDLHVRPGASGGPVLDSHGRVCGVVCGGLDLGLGGINWLIPATALDQLRRRPKVTNLAAVRNDRAATEISFSADLKVANEPERVISGLRVVKLRTKSLGEITRSNFDPLGLTQMTTYFQQINQFTTPPDWSGVRFDLYLVEPSDLPRGKHAAVVAVPEGMSIGKNPAGDGLYAFDGSSGIEWYLLKQSVAGSTFIGGQPWWGYTEAMKYEAILLVDPTQWGLVPGFFDPVGRVGNSGYMVQRRSLWRYMLVPMMTPIGWQQTNQALSVATLTHSGKDQVMISVGVLIRDYQRAAMATSGKVAVTYARWSLGVMASGLGNTELALSDRANPR